MPVAVLWRCISFAASAVPVTALVACSARNTQKRTVPNPFAPWQQRKEIEMIPFTQYLLPNGRRRDEAIERPPEIEALAQQFIASGGRYECEILTTGHVSLTAVKTIDENEGPQDVEIIICANGPGIKEKVDELVKRSIRHIGSSS